MHLNQLWQKLALGFIGVAVAAILTAYLLVNFTVNIRFQGYVTGRDRAIYKRIGESLAQTYAEHGGWDEQLSESLPHFAMMSGVSIKVVDKAGRVIDKTFGGDRLNSMTERMTGMSGHTGPVKELIGERIEVPLIIHERRVGSVYVTPLIKAGQLVEDKEFRQSINSSLIFGGSLAVLVALTLSFFVSTRLTKPLTAITQAAKKMAAGDLTQRIPVKNKDEIGQLGEAFNRLSLALERQERLRKNMTADIAHELRTPLATIRSHIEAYIDGVIKPDREDLESIHEEILRLGRLVDDLGELALADSGNLGLDKQPLDLSVLIKKVVLGLQPLFDEKQLELDVRIANSISGEYDEDKLKQVLVNIIVNAIKFTPEKGTVTVEAGVDDRFAVIQVSDTGVGIKAKALSNVFERFYRVDKSRNRATGGSGIGLTIAKKLTELHGGAVNVVSKVGVGTTVTVKLPKNS